MQPDDMQSLFDLFYLLGKGGNGGRSPMDFARSQEFRHRKRSANYRRTKHRSKR